MSCFLAKAGCCFYCHSHPLDATSRLAIIQILEDRYGKKSMVITSQLPFGNWYEYIGESTIADAIMDRLAGIAHRFDLKGESLRKKVSTIKLYLICKSSFYYFGSVCPRIVVQFAPEFSESEDFVVFDTSWDDLMPYSGRYINLENKTYLLCNNTRYENDVFKAIDGFPFPVKLKIECPSDSTRQIDTNTIKQLIDQVYQFSQIY